MGLVHLHTCLERHRSCSPEVESHFCRECISRSTDGRVYWLQSGLLNARQEQSQHSHHASRPLLTGICNWRHEGAPLLQAKVSAALVIQNWRRTVRTREPSANRGDQHWRVGADVQAGETLKTLRAYQDIIRLGPCSDEKLRPLRPTSPTLYLILRKTNHFSN